MFSKDMKVILAARNIEKLRELKEETKAHTVACDASDIESVNNLFQETDKLIGTPNLVIYNPYAMIKGGITELDPYASKIAINTTHSGAYLVAQEAVKKMLKRKSGSVIFTGATASIKRFANSLVFAMGRFGLRGLAQSLSRELHPKNIYTWHFIVDGCIGKQSNGLFEMINPDSIAKLYLQFHE
jgi:NADP-dependent 3-hydroxy acid dehydrogenase YdfG